MNSVAPLPPIFESDRAAALGARLGAKYGDRVTASITRPATEGRHVSFPGGLAEALRRALAARDVTSLCSHQVRASAGVAWNHEMGV